MLCTVLLPEPDDILCIEENLRNVRVCERERGTNCRFFYIRLHTLTYAAIFVRLDCIN